MGPGVSFRLSYAVARNKLPSTTGSAQKGIYFTHTKAIVNQVALQDTSLPSRDSRIWLFASGYNTNQNMELLVSIREMTRNLFTVS